MLVITRKSGESVVIDANGVKIELLVTETSSDRVKLGFVAPREVKILRSELLAAESANVQAAQSLPKAVLEKLLAEKREKK